MTLSDPVRWFVRSAADLVVGSACAGCGPRRGRPGVLCDTCRRPLAGPALPVDPLPGRPDVRMVGTCRYGGSVRAAIIEHKERGRLTLARPLGDAVAVAVTALVTTSGGCGQCGDRAVVLVPVPSARAVVRRRGHDPVARMSRRAARTLGRSGHAAVVVPALRHVRKVRDQTTLGRERRETNLRQAMAVRPGAERLARARCVVLVDDIVTSGATAREGVRALAEVGMRPCGVAVVALVT